MEDSIESDIRAQENTSLIKKKRGSGAIQQDPVDLQDASQLVKGGVAHEVYENQDDSIQGILDHSRNKKQNNSSGELKLPSIYDGNQSSIHCNILDVIEEAEVENKQKVKAKPSVDVKEQTSGKFRFTAKVQPYMSIDPGIQQSKKQRIKMPGSSNNKEYHQSTDGACEDLFEDSIDGDRNRIQRRNQEDNDTIAQSKGQKSQLGGTINSRTETDANLRESRLKRNGHSASGTQFPPINQEIASLNRENPTSMMSKLNASALSGKNKNQMLQAISGFLAQQTKIVLTLNKKFLDYSAILDNLTDQISIKTGEYPVIIVLINRTSERVILVVNDQDRQFFILQYDLKTYEQVNKFEIVGEYLKGNIVEQNEEGNLFAFAYMDDGYWHLLTFDFDKVIDDLEVNLSFGIDNFTTPISGFYQPFAMCCFLQNSQIFFSFFHRPNKKHHHFSYDPFAKKVCQQLETYTIQDCSKKNFPQKTFYDAYLNQIYCFYRQGDSFTINSKNLSEFAYEKITDFDLGDMIMFKNTVLIARSSQQILFFKQEYNQEKKIKIWKQYHTFQSRGFLSGNQTGRFFNIIEDQYIKFYAIDDEQTWEPKLQNVMFNFMQCSMMVLGEHQRFCITYKQNQKDINIFKRKMVHDFKICVDSSKSYVNALGLKLNAKQQFVVAQGGQVYFYNDTSYQRIYEIDLNLEKTDSREPLQILSISTDKNNDYITMFVGKQLIRDEELLIRLVVLSRSNDKAHNFQIHSQIDMQEKNMSGACKRICFDIHDSQQIILLTEKEILTYNFITDSMRTRYDYETDFTEQPEFFVFNQDQTICVISSSQDSLYVDTKSKSEIDIDQAYQISDIKNVIFYQENFYILANKHHGILGVYLLKIPEHLSEEDADPKDNNDQQFLIKWKNKLDIGEADIFIHSQKLKKKSTNNGLKTCQQLVLSFKNIYINVYSIYVLDLDRNVIIYRHESFCLWESSVMSFYNSTMMDLICLQDKGINIMSLSRNPQNHGRHFRSKKDHSFLHALPSCDYLRLDNQNHILFDCSSSEKIVSIQSQYFNNRGDTCFESIYNIRISPLAIRDLILFQSIFYCETSIDVLKLVELQENPRIFYQSYLELERRNMISILAFDNNSIKALLSDKYQDHFQSEFPIFYKNRYQTVKKKDGRLIKVLRYNNAIDVALSSNQIRAVNLIIAHIVKYQNNYVSSYLFNFNLLKLMEKGINTNGLLASQVFEYRFEYDEWPQAHQNLEKIITGYNGSLFEIRHSYRKCFPDLEDIETNEDTQTKMYKIKYCLNLLPNIKEAEDGTTFIAMCQERGEEELSLFKASTTLDLIKFKWNAFAYKLHYFGAFMHLTYIMTLTVYIYNTYLIGTYGEVPSAAMPFLMCFGITYPFIYDTTQLFKSGLAYFDDPWNWSDFAFQWAGVVNIIFQFTNSPADFECTVSMSIVLLLSLVKTLFFLRIFDNLSYLVTLIRSVIWDLRIFMCFYLIMIYMFSLILGVMGWQNFTRQDVDFPEGILERENYPGVEYKYLGKFVGNFLTVLRMSLGGTDFFSSTFLPQNVNILFWFVWACICFITSIILLNFLIAEASASYGRVSKNLPEYLQFQKVALICESEEMMPASWRSDHILPKYLVVREKVE